MDLRESQAPYTPEVFLDSTFKIEILPSVSFALLRPRGSAGPAFPRGEHPCILLYRQHIVLCTNLKTFHVIVFGEFS